MVVVVVLEELKHATGMFPRDGKLASRVQVSGLGFKQKKSHLIKDGFLNRINGGSDETRTRFASSSLWFGI